MSGHKSKSVERREKIMAEAKDEENDSKKRFEEYQLTIDFHMSRIQAIFKDDHRATLIVGRVKDNDISVVYSNVNAAKNGDVVATLKAAIKQVEKNRKKISSEKGKKKGK